MSSVSTLTHAPQSRLASKWQKSFVLRFFATMVTVSWNWEDVSLPGTSSKV